MKTLAMLFLLLVVFDAFGRSSDPNLRQNTSNRGKVVAEACTEFTHPCNGQVAPVTLVDQTRAPRATPRQGTPASQPGQK